MKSRNGPNLTRSGKMIVPLKLRFGLIRSVLPCGGEPGISDTHVDGLWWLDLLGLIAQRGQRVIIRQTLCDSHYALIDDLTLEPNPDYWGSVLWKHLMGTKVLQVNGSRDSAYICAYVHCLKDKRGSIVVLLLKVSETQKAEIILEGIDNLGGAFDL
jgi:hypothetical protein